MRKIVKPINFVFFYDIIKGEEKFFLSGCGEIGRRVRFRFW